jgi:hypothetical protein
MLGHFAREKILGSDREGNKMAENPGNIRQPLLLLLFKFVPQAVY